MRNVSRIFLCFLICFLTIKFDFALAKAGPQFFELSIEETIQEIQSTGKKIVVITGFSALNYQYPSDVVTSVTNIANRYDKSKTIFVLGGTSDGIGIAYSSLDGLGYETIGVVSIKAKDYPNSLSKFAKRIYFIPDDTWGGMDQSGKLFPTSEVNVEIADDLYGIGGNEIAGVELKVASQQGKQVEFQSAQMNRQYARTRIDDRGQVVRNFPWGAAEEELLDAGIISHNPSQFLGSGRSLKVDELGELSMEVGFDQSRGSTGKQLRIYFFEGANKPLPSENIASYFEVYKNGELVTNLKSEIKEVHAFLDLNMWSLGTGQKYAESGKSSFEIKFNGKTLSSFNVDLDNGEITSFSSSKKLSQFDVRSAEKSTLGQKFNLISTSKKGALKVDLHNHFAGAIMTDDLWDIGLKNKFLYPGEYLEEMFPNTHLKNWLGESKIIDGKKYIELHEAFGFEEKFKSKISIKPGEVIDFSRMEQIYKWRSPLTKDLKLAPSFLESIAMRYNTQGINYVELSLSNIVEDEWLKMAKKVIPNLEQKYGVKIRFDAAIWRGGDQQYMDQMVQKISDKLFEPLIAGVDFMGEENNSTMYFAKQMKELSKLREIRPGFQIRVHAGENVQFPNNVLDAIELGATRIGHGIYGVSDEALQLAKEKNIIIELNLNSNIALSNINGRKQIPLKRYLESGVRLTFGSDGQGVYSTTILSEESVLRSYNPTESQLQAIIESDSKYQSEQVKFEEAIADRCNRLFKTAIP